MSAFGGKSGHQSEYTECPLMSLKRERKLPQRDHQPVEVGGDERDVLTHPYLAGHGYASVRVDVRGCGESNGSLFNEYAKQE